MTLVEALLSVWPILLAVMGLAVGWGSALARVGDLKQRVTVLEQQVSGKLASDLEDIKLDVRELMTLVRRAKTEE